MFFLDFQKKAPTSKTLAEKATTKKRPASARETPPPKTYKGFTAKRKVDRPALAKVELPLKVDEIAIIPFVGEVDLTPSTSPKQLDTVVLLEDTKGAEEQIS